jgi:DNA-binding response OmpR family regulator
MPKKILVIDDEPQIIEICEDYLRSNGYTAISALSGLDGIEKARTEQPDLIVLDIMMPEMDGYEVTKRIRKVNNVPIIMLTARVEETDMLIGLELGADDYITKPFSPRELIARIKTVLRRSSNEPEADVMRVGSVELDKMHYQIVIAERVIPVTPTEMEIMQLLMSHPGRIFSRSQLLSAAQGVSFGSYERAIDSHIRNLRRKLEPDDVIQTIYGVGYKFVG